MEENMSYNVIDTSITKSTGRNEKVRNRINIFLFLLLFVFLFLEAKEIKRERCEICPEGFFQGPNLIENGNFDGFGPYPVPTGLNAPTQYCSQYVNMNNCIHNGQYCIIDNPRFLNPSWISDQQSENHGKFFVCDGFQNNKTKLFEKTFQVEQYSNYVFCAWFTNLFRDKRGIAPVVELYINSSSPIATLYLTNDSTTTTTFWHPLSAVWSSGSNTSVTIQIFLKSVQGTLGNDIGMDDLSFSICEPRPYEICDCGKWGQTTVIWKTPCAPESNTLVLNGCNSTEQKLCCVCICNPIFLYFKYWCEPNIKICQASYEWTVTGPNGFIKSGKNNPCWFRPTMTGLYSITVKAFCGGKECCPSCTINLKVIGMVDCDEFEPPIPGTHGIVRNTNSENN